MSGFAQRFREEGLEQGRKQGIEQGLQQGEAAVLLSLLEEKFGSEVVQAYRERVEQADADTLLEWSKRILTAEDPEAVFH